MTRSEFLSDVTDWWELKNFCDDHGCDVLNYVYNEDTRDEIINEWLLDWARQDTWKELYERLDDIPTGYAFYVEDEYGGWEGLDNYCDFEQYQGEVLEWADGHGIFEEEDEEDEEVEEIEECEPLPEEECEPFVEADFSFDDLLSTCVATIAKVQEAAKLSVEEDESAILDLLF